MNDEHEEARAARSRASRARSGGSAQPVGVGPVRRPEAPRSPANPPPASSTPGAAARPPSFEPGSGRLRAAAPPRPATTAPARRSAAPPAETSRTRVMPAGNAPRPAPAQHPVRNDPPRPTQPGPTGRPPTGGPPGAGRQHTRGTYIRRRITVVVIVVLVLLLAWPIGLLIWADGKIQHTEALSTAADTPGTTYLLAGSDSRDDGYLAGDTTSGQRTDTIMLLTVPPSGPTSLISLPRDTYVADIPGFGPGKLNAAFAHGGAPLLVQTVEGLTGITVDHYVEIGMGGVASLVDAVGGVELCYDADVNDPDSGMVWTAGCHHADGASALAFARMRKQDPLGDIGRAIRQQQVIEATTAAMNSPSNFVLPTRQVALIDAGTGALVTDPGTGILDLGRMALAFRTATGPEGVRGTPPIADPDYRPGGNLGSTVLLDPEAAPLFFQQVVDGTLPEPTPTPTDAG